MKGNREQAQCGDGAPSSPSQEHGRRWQVLAQAQATTLVCIPLLLLGPTRSGSGPLTVVFMGKSPSPSEPWFSHH